MSFATNLVAIVVRLVGQTLVKNLVAAAFPGGEVSITSQGQLELKSPPAFAALKKTTTLVIESLAKNFGHDYVERMVLYLYNNFKEKYDAREVRASVPEMLPPNFLKKEKI